MKRRLSILNPIGRAQLALGLLLLSGRAG